MALPRRYDSLISAGRTVCYGYHLDDPTQWNEVVSIPSEIEDKVESLFLSGCSIAEVKSSLPNKYKWVADFMGAYPESLYIGRHGRW